MVSTKIKSALDLLLDFDYEVEPIPDQVIDKFGNRISLKSDKWRLHIAGDGSNLIDVSNINNPLIKYALSRYYIFCIKRLAPKTVYTIATLIRIQLRKVGFLDNLNEQMTAEKIKVLLKNAMISIQNYLRNEKKFFSFYEIREWYVWCSEEFPYFGFDEDYAIDLENLRIPGDPRGEAVRSNNPEKGPLNTIYEEPLVHAALKNDRSTDFKHYQERLAIALCIAFGRNTLNYTLMREEDFIKFAADPSIPELWQLKIPRIKKKSKPRGLFRTENCEARLADMIKELIDLNQQFSTVLNGKEMPRPLFLNLKPNRTIINGDSKEYAFHFDTRQFHKLIQSWVSRVNLISPITNELLRLNNRRFRYTFACNMARQGASRAMLAEMLDHTDTQSVAVYYELSDQVVGILDKALVNKIGPVLGFFKGNVLSDKESAINGSDPTKHQQFVNEREPDEIIDIGVCGKDDLCLLDPPYSCYLCPKFQPYASANHERVLEILLEDRENRIKKYESHKLAVQLDHVIYAVAEAAKACKGVADA